MPTAGLLILRDGEPEEPEVTLSPLLREIETCVAGHACVIIDDATARRHSRPIPTATIDGTVKRLLNRRMGAGQHMRWLHAARI